MVAQLLTGIAAALDRAGIRYMIIGGQAVLKYGEPRLTRDIDVTIDILPDDADKLMTIAAELGLTIDVDNAGDFVKRTFVLPYHDAVSGMRIDFIFSYSAYEKAAFDRVIMVHMDGIPVKFASPEDLIIHKIIAGRARDIEDVRGLLAKNPTLDVSYIRKWLKDFDIDLGFSASERFEMLLRSVRSN